MSNTVWLLLTWLLRRACQTVSLGLCDLVLEKGQIVNKTRRKIITGRDLEPKLNPSINFQLPMRYCEVVLTNVALLSPAPRTIKGRRDVLLEKVVTSDLVLHSPAEEIGWELVGK